MKILGIFGAVVLSVVTLVICSSFDVEIHFGLILSVFLGLLNLILFFKIWGMTDDVCQIRKILEKKNPESPAQNEKKVEENA